MVTKQNEVKFMKLFREKLPAMSEELLLDIQDKLLEEQQDRENLSEERIDANKK